MSRFLCASELVSNTIKQIKCSCQKLSSKSNLCIDFGVDEQLNWAKRRLPTSFFDLFLLEDMSSTNNLHLLQTIYLSKHINFLILVTNDINNHFQIIRLVNEITIATRSILFEIKFVDLAQNARQAFDLHLSRVIINRLDTIWTRKTNVKFHIFVIIVGHSNIPSISLLQSHLIKFILGEMVNLLTVRRKRRLL